MANCEIKKDCLSIPFPPKCFDFCIEKILRVATRDDKIRVLGMNEDLAHAIFQAYNNGKKPIRSFNDLKQALSETQIRNIEKIFYNLTQNQLNYFIPKL